MAGRWAVKAPGALPQQRWAQGCLLSAGQGPLGEACQSQLHAPEGLTASPVPSWVCVERGLSYNDPRRHRGKPSPNSALRHFPPAGCAWRGTERGRAAHRDGSLAPCQQRCLSSGAACPDAGPGPLTPDCPSGCGFPSGPFPRAVTQSSSMPSKPTSTWLEPWP